MRYVLQLDRIHRLSRLDNSAPVDRGRVYLFFDDAVIRVGKRSRDVNERLEKEVREVKLLIYTLYTTIIVGKEHGPVQNV